MTIERLRYVTRRRNRKGERWYWQRKGIPLVRLPADRVKRFDMAHKLNQQADRVATIETAEEGTVAWLIQHYVESDRYKDLKPASKLIYAPWLQAIKDIWGAMPPRAITRRVAITYIEGIESRHTRQQAAAVLRNVLEDARYLGLVDVNNAAGLRLKMPQRRQARWEWADIDKFLAACKPPAVRVAFNLMLYSAQRPSDVLAMRWSAYDGRTIKLRQKKTGRLIEVPCHRDLRAVVEEAKKGRRGVTIVAKPDGTPYSPSRMGDLFREVCRKTEIEGLQARDLRRTAIILLGEAGCTEAQVAAVSGHSIEKTRQILETYLPRTTKMAEAAIRKWEQNDDRV